MIKIPESEFKFSFSRSGGPGGQNVNKLETKVTARWNIRQSGILSENQKQLLLAKLNQRINADGELAVSAQSERSQSQNKRKAVERMNFLVAGALRIPKRRTSTKPTRSSKEKRLRRKKIRSEKKALRSRIHF